ncbi:hypothetical protein JW872_04050 [Candidatus Babeliales bacterium]|nr:hypothetical protein [Candidatus Babeliales bacterium]
MRRFSFCVCLCALILRQSLLSGGASQGHQSKLSALERLVDGATRCYQKIIDQGVEKFGTEKLTSEAEDLVTDVAQKMGVESVQFRYLNLRGLQTFGLYNAVAMQDAYVLVSKYFFTKLPIPLQRFLIGHELAHIKQHDAKKSYCWSVFL